MLKPEDLNDHTRPADWSIIALCVMGLFTLLFIKPAHAQANTAVLTCTAPTKNTDGSTITPAQLPLTFKFAEGTAAGTYPNVSPAQAACAYTFTGLTATTHFFVATVTDKLGTTSAQTPSVSKLVTNPTPLPPTALTVAADPTAYEIRTTTTGTLTASRIGRVELGTKCTDEEQTVAGVKYNRVELRNVDLVVWPQRSPTTAQAWAKCSLS